MEGTGFIVLGASGLIGRAFRRRLGSRKAILTYNRHPFKGGVRFDPLVDRLSVLGEGVRDCRSAVILFADSKPDSCFTHPRESQTVNVDCLPALVEDLLELDIQPIFTSTELVFDGSRGMYAEDDSPNPILLYGRQKLAAERLLMGLSPSVLIFRLAKSFGTERGDGTFFTEWLRALEYPAAVLHCAADQAFSPIHSDDVAASVIRAADERLSGLYHLGGRTRFTRLELLNMLMVRARAHFEVQAQIVPCSIDDLPLPEKRPHDVSLDVRRLDATGCLQTRDVKDVCDELVSGWARAAA